MNFTKFAENSASTNLYNRNQQGVFALHPAMTPKYEFQKGLRDAEYKETMARMFLSLQGTDAEARKAYLRSLPPDDSVQALARVLIGDQTSGGTGFIDFFLDQIQEQFVEKVQVSEVLSDNYVAYFFGASPPIFTFSGNLLNSFQDDQRIGMALAYNHLIRGTQCARRGSLLRIRYDSVIISGTVLSMGQTLNAANELVVPFNFQLLVKEYIVVVKPILAVTKVETQFDPNGVLTPIGSPSDIRVRATMYVPDKLAAESVAGPNSAQVPQDDPNKSKSDNLQSRAAQDGAPVITSDVRGTVDSLISLPPPQYSSL